MVVIIAAKNTKPPKTPRAIIPPKKGTNYAYVRPTGEEFCKTGENAEISINRFGQLIRAI